RVSLPLGFRQFLSHLSPLTVLGDVSGCGEHVLVALSHWLPCTPRCLDIVVAIVHAVQMSYLKGDAMIRTQGYVTRLHNNRLRRRRGRGLLALVLMACVLLVANHRTMAQPQAKPTGEMRWALYVTLAPSWFDPGEVVG